MLQALIFFISPLFVVLMNVVLMNTFEELFTGLDQVLYCPYVCKVELVFDTGTKNPPDTQIQIQMTTSVSVDKSVSISMISIPSAVGIYYQFQLFSLDFL